MSRRRTSSGFPGDFLRENRFVIPVFFLLACYLLYQYSHVFLYYDDFGYCSLSYGWQVPDLPGHDYTLGQMFSYLAHHYRETNGRLLYTGLFLLLYRVGGLPLLQVSAAAIVLGVILSAYACIDKSEMGAAGRALLAAILSLLFGTISVTVARQGLYWFAAFYSYVTPAIPFLALSRMLFKDSDSRRRGRGIGETALLTLLAFLTGFSQEQWWVAACVLIGLSILAGLAAGTRRDPVLPALILKLFIFLGAFLGGLIILLSPALRLRIGRDTANLEFASLSLPGKIIHNLRIILTVFTTESNKPWVTIFLLAMILLSLRLIFSGQGNPILHGIHLAAALLVFVEAGPVIRHRFILWTIYLLIATAEIIFFYVTEGNIAHLSVYLAACASVACMLVVPELPNRFLTMWLLLSLVLIGDIAASRLSAADSMPVILFAVVLAGFAVPNMERIAEGYRENYRILLENEALLEDASGSGAANSAGTPETITLERQASYDYGGEMMYVENYSFMEYWIREYYDLPDSLEIRYQE